MILLAPHFGNLILSAPDLGVIVSWHPKCFVHPVVDIELNLFPLTTYRLLMPVLSNNTVGQGHESQRLYPSQGSSISHKSRGSPQSRISAELPVFFYRKPDPKNGPVK
jgi:hypothetical protein